MERRRNDSGEYTGDNTIKKKENILILSVSQIKQLFTRMLINETRAPLPSDYYSKKDSKKTTKRPSSQKSATINPTLSHMPFLSPPPPSQRSTNSSSSLLSSSLQETRRIYKPHPKFRPIPSELCQDSYVDRQYRPLPPLLPPPPRPYECKKCSKLFLHSYDILSHKCHF